LLFRNWFRPFFLALCYVRLSKCINIIANPANWESDELFNNMGVQSAPTHRSASTMVVVLARI
jgi:hypothetical protein